MTLSSEHRRAVMGLSALLALFVLLVVSQGGEQDDTQGYELRAIFNDVTGVQRGTIVRLAGIPIGHVTHMTLMPNGKAQLVMRVTDDIEIPSDSAIAVQKDGLFGGTVLVVEVGGAMTMLAPQTRFSYSEDALTLDDLLDAVIQQGEQNRKKKG